VVPTVGRIVLYRQRYGLQTWLPAIITVTSDTYEPGYFANPKTVEGKARLTFNSSMHQYDTAPSVDAEGDIYIPSPIPAVKSPNHVHLQVFSPTGNNYAEYNVHEGTLPGEWKWPEIIK